MAFTEPVKTYPYVALARHDGSTYTIGDLDGKTVGFIEGDQIISSFPDLYRNIQYRVETYDSPNDAMFALENGIVDGVVTAGTEIIDEMLLARPQLRKVAEIRDLTSDMTLSTRLEDQVLADIINRILAEDQDQVHRFVEEASVLYFRQMLIRKESEWQWFEENPYITVGVASDYLPIDHVDSEGQYIGVAGEFFQQFSDMIGLEVKTVYLPFDELYMLMEQGQIDMLNMARTEERMKSFIYTHALSEDRDVIYGRQNSDHIFDVYNLEGRSVAVISGFWHEELLEKNLKSPNIVETQSIEESLAKLSRSNVDYFIENPLVAEYYLDGLGYTDITAKGETSSDSLLYFGMQKQHQPMVDVFNRAMVLMDYDRAVYDGLQRVPLLRNRENLQLTYMLMVIVVILAVVIAILVNVFRDLLKQRTETNLLRERQRLIYTDALTGMYNRVYFNDQEKTMDDQPFPQCFIMMDLNELKKTNDTYGHSAGDLLIQHFADILLRTLPRDRVMRMGGDEFFAFISPCTIEDAERLLKEMKTVSKETKIPIGNGEVIEPHASMGYYIRKSKEVSTDRALHEADMTMYKDKEKMKAQRVQKDKG